MYYIVSLQQNIKKYSLAVPQHIICSNYYRGSVLIKCILVYLYLHYYVLSSTYIVYFILVYMYAGL